MDQRLQGRGTWSADLIFQSVIRVLEICCSLFSNFTGSERMKRYFVLFVGIFAVIILAESANAQVACTHYASPGGGGNGLSQSSPFQIGNFWKVAQPGNTLCLLDG